MNKRQEELWNNIVFARVHHMMHVSQLPTKVTPTELMTTEEIYRELINPRKTIDVE